MLQEILLSLSGFPSPVWEQTREDGTGNGLGVNQYISPPERAILETLSQLSSQHIEIKNIASRISSEHPSAICRAVASNVLHKQCHVFREKVVKVESDILHKDAAFVGGYDIVPLSAILGEFKPWLRPFEWLSAMLKKMEDDSQGELSSRGIDMLHYLAQETHTGYTDIEQIAVQLVITAQTVWMRYLSTWVLYGKLPGFSAHEFFIHSESEVFFGSQGVLNDNLRPAFVTPLAANAANSAGNALNQLRFRNKGVADPVMALLPRHLGYLQSLRFPLNPILLEKAIVAINDSISHNALSQLLPLSDVLQLMDVILQYFLLNRGEFARSLVEIAALQIKNREQTQTSKPVRKIGRLNHLQVRAAETDLILNEAWSQLSSLQGDAWNEDSTFDLAKTIVKLQLAKDQKLLSTLLPTISVLTFALPKESTLSLFLDKHSIELYQTISSFLLSIRRTSIHLSELWKLSSHRRTFPAPQGPPNSGTASGQRANQQRRHRETQRRIKLRKHWATVGKALYTLNEIDAYLHGEVIRHSYGHFRTWLNTPTTRPSSAKSESSKTLHHSGDKSKDPGSLASAHKSFLDALYVGLLLTNSNYIDSLRSLLSTIDHYIALFTRLQSVREGLDLQEDDGVLDAFSNYVQDEQELLAEMQRTSSTLEMELIEVITTIQGIEQNQNVDVVVGSIASLELGQYAQAGEDGKFRPWRKRTLDRLIMKLDFVTYGSESAEDGNKALLQLDPE